MANPPHVADGKQAVKLLHCAKAPRCNGIPPEVFKNRRLALKRRVLRLSLNIWESEILPKNWNHHPATPQVEGLQVRLQCLQKISLLSITSKVLSNLLLMRLMSTLTESRIANWLLAWHRNYQHHLRWESNPGTMLGTPESYIVTNLETIRIHTYSWPKD